MRHESFREFWLVVEKASDGYFLQTHDLAFVNCCGRRHAPTPFTLGTCGRDGRQCTEMRNVGGAGARKLDDD
jgi:hypothetical protein